MMDEFSVSAFEVMGFKQPFSDAIVSAFDKFKTLKDRLQPGRLTPEGFAFVAMLATKLDVNAVAKNPDNDVVSATSTEPHTGEPKCQPSPKMVPFPSRRA